MRVCKICGSGDFSNGKKPACRRCNVRRVVSWKRRHPEKHRENERARYHSRQKQDPEYLRQKSRKSRSANRERARQVYRDWYAFIRSGNVSSAQLKALYAAADGKCHYCGTEINKPSFKKSTPRGFDHVIPRTKGGSHTLSNLVVCCAKCNVSKGVKLIQK